VYNNLANVYFILKDLEKSYEYYQKAISLAKQEKLFLEEIKTSSNLVDVLFFLKNYERVKDILRQNSIYFRQVGDILGIINTLTKYGKLYYHLGEGHYTKSKKSFENALELINKIADQIPFHAKAQMEWECFLYLGIYENSLQHDDLAEDFLLKSLEAIRTFEVGDSVNQAIGLKHLGQLYKNRGEFKRAIEYLALAGDIYYKFGEDFQLAELKTQIGYIYLNQLNDDIEAVKFLEEALEIFENKNFEKQCAEILHKLGDISIDKGMIDMAISNFERAKFFYEEIKDQYNTNLLNEKLNSLVDFHDYNDLDL
jgi:tetratricopeptide (TPR) repeat protein